MTAPSEEQIARALGWLDKVIECQECPGDMRKMATDCHKLSECGCVYSHLFETRSFLAALSAPASGGELARALAELEDVSGGASSAPEEWHSMAVAPPFAAPDAAQRAQDHQRGFDEGSAVMRGLLEKDAAQREARLRMALSEIHEHLMQIIGRQDDHVAVARNIARAALREGE